MVHHIRKQNDCDVFNRVSGTTGIMGSSDTTFILDKKSRDEQTATLYMTGRDVEYQEFELKFYNCSWELVNRLTQKEIQKRKVPNVIYKVIEFMQEKEEWKGTATELLQELAETEVAPNIITKILNEYHFTELKENQISYSFTRNKDGRQISLKKLVTVDDS